MAGRFHWFVVLAGMRTGSNLLESSLNAIEGITCHGEAFNLAFVGYPNRDSLLGIGRDRRDADPGALLDAIRAAPGLNGFRLFADHDPRVLMQVLDDPACAKIVLTRNPLDSYVSRKIATETGQWLLRGDARRRRTAKVAFDATEFDAHLAERETFAATIRHRLQSTGQTAFAVDYDDLADLAVFNGLLRYLGHPAQLAALPGTLVKQNPEPMAEKVTNPAEMAEALAAMDRFGLGRIPDFEPARGPAVPGFVGNDAGLLLMPVRGAGEARLRDWMAAMAPVHDGFTQATLRDWRRRHPGSRSFTVVRHPLPRAFVAFRDLILTGRFAAIRDHLRRVHTLALDGLDPADTAAMRAAFHGFLRWLRLNLNGQTAVRVDSAWASQTAVLAGFARLAPPDRVIREDDLEPELAHLALLAGASCPPLPPDRAAPDGLAAICTDETEALARAAYLRDYTAFGFDCFTDTH